MSGWKCLCVVLIVSSGVRHGNKGYARAAGARIPARRATLLSIIVLLGSACLHARVQLALEKDGCPPIKSVGLERGMELNLGGCARSETQATGTETLIRQHFWLWGLFPRELEYDAVQVCPKGLLEVHQYTSWQNGLAENFTFGIYSPRTLRLVCSGGPS